MFWYCLNKRKDLLSFEQIKTTKFNICDFLFKSLNLDWNTKHIFYKENLSLVSRTKSIWCQEPSWRARRRKRTAKFFFTCQLTNRKHWFNQENTLNFVNPFQDFPNRCHHHLHIIAQHYTTEQIRENKKIITHFRSTENFLLKKTPPDIRPPASTALKSHGDDRKGAPPWASNTIKRVVRGEKRRRREQRSKKVKDLAGKEACCQEGNRR